MIQYVKRNIEKELITRMKYFPVVAVLGPRQCGKSTLIKELSKRIENFLYLDLQNDDDIKKLDEPNIFFNFNKDKTIDNISGQWEFNFKLGNETVLNI